MCLLWGSISGCAAKLNDSREVTVESVTVKSVIYDAVRRDRRIGVTVKAPVDLDVYVVLEEDQQAAVKALENNKTPANVLASLKKTRAGALGVMQFPVPSGKGFAVLLYSRGHPQDVKVQLTVREF
ncbi:MAG: hypothetical protein C4297_05850 [Gemmataceae bacterium]